MSPPDILALQEIHPLFTQRLREHFQVHVDLHLGETEAFAALAPRITGLAASGESVVSGALMDQLPALRVVSVFGVGYDGIDIASARERGIAVTHTPDVLTDDVADLAMALMLGVARGLVRADAHVRSGRWPAGTVPLGRKVSGARLGIVGFGRIGQAIASRAAALGMSIAYTARSARPGAPYRFFDTTAELAQAVDFLVVITPGGEQTRHLINAEVLQALGPEGYLINVARGSVVDEAALLAALQSGGIAGAGLDVFAQEPHVPEAFWALPNVVLTPHMASATVQTRQAMAELAVSNMLAGTAGQPVLTMVPELKTAASP